MPANNRHKQSPSNTASTSGPNDTHPFDRAMHEYMRECEDLAAEACRDEPSVTLDTPVSEQRLQDFLGHVRTTFNRCSPKE